MDTPNKPRRFRQVRGNRNHWIDLKNDVSIHLSDEGVYSFYNSGKLVSPPDFLRGTYVVDYDPITGAARFTPSQTAPPRPVPAQNTTQEINACINGYCGCLDTNCKMIKEAIDLDGIAKNWCVDPYRNTTEGADIKNPITGERLSRREKNTGSGGEMPPSPVRRKSLADQRYEYIYDMPKDKAFRAHAQRIDRKFYRINGYYPPEGIDLFNPPRKAIKLWQKLRNLFF